MAVLLWLVPEFIQSEASIAIAMDKFVTKKRPNELTSSPAMEDTDEKNCKKSWPSRFTKQDTVPERALKAPFLALYHIARAKTPHTVGEDLILPAIKDIVCELFGEEAAKKVDTVPLSNNTMN